MLLHLGIRQHWSCFYFWPHTWMSEVYNKHFNSGLSRRFLWLLLAQCTNKGSWYETRLAIHIFWRSCIEQTSIINREKWFDFRNSPISRCQGYSLFHCATKSESKDVIVSAQTGVGKKLQSSLLSPILYSHSTFSNLRLRKLMPCWSGARLIDIVKSFKQRKEIRLQIS